eukprot:5989582-Amphidinium_carterae.1
MSKDGTARAHKGEPCENRDPFQIWDGCRPPLFSKELTTAEFTRTPIGLGVNEEKHAPHQKTSHTNSKRKAWLSALQSYALRSAPTAANLTRSLSTCHQESTAA